MKPNTSRREFIATSSLMAAGLAAHTADEPPLAPPDKQPPNLKLPEPPAKTLGWAIVGLGKLALEEVMPAFSQCKFSRPTALVSGHPDKARKVAAAYGVDLKKVYDYDSYDRIASDPAIDIVYIILPNSMHSEYTIRALNAGKHVLCEKPMAVTTQESEQMIAASRKAKRQLMIAYRLRYEPFNMTAIELCRQGELGKLKTITASNGQDVKAPNIRLSRTLGGGPLGDIGIYCLNAARYLTGEEPAEVTAVAHQPGDDPRFREVPECMVFTLKFPSGALATCDCSFGIAESRQFLVQGSKGVLKMDNAFAYRGQRLFVSTGDEKVERTLEPVNHFAAEMDHFSECVLANKSSRTPGEEGLADMQAMAAIEEAARSGRKVLVGST